MVNITCLKLNVDDLTFKTRWILSTSLPGSPSGSDEPCQEMIYKNLNDLVVKFATKKMVQWTFLVTVIMSLPDKNHYKTSQSKLWYAKEHFHTL